MPTLAHYVLTICILRLTFSFPILVREPNAFSPRDVSATKSVFAHHIVGNTYTFTTATWTRDIQLAYASGINAFALNLGNEPWEIGQVQLAYDAAEQSGTDFKMFISFDMSNLPCASISDAQSLVTIIRNQSSHPSQFRYGPNNRAFVSTFSGETCTFSAPSPSQGWGQHFVAPLSPDLHFVPALFGEPSQLFVGDPLGNGGFGGIINGDFNWDSGWPTQLTTAALAQAASDPIALAALLDTNVTSLASVISAPNTSTSPAGVISRSTTNTPSISFAAAGSKFSSPDTMTDADRAAFASVAGAFKLDGQHLSAINKYIIKPSGVANVAGGNGSGPSSGHTTYMAAASPWFFTHFSPSSSDKNFILLADNHLYPKRWETLVASRDTVDLVEICSWNDFGESHYIGPTEGGQPLSSQAWVNGHDHSGWLDLTAYYTQAFKTGVYPNITRDKVIMWARPHPRDAQASEDPLQRPTNFQLTEDSFWVTVFVPAPSTVTLTTSLTPSNDSSNSVSFQVPAGASHLKAPLVPGGGMGASVSRGGKTVLDFVAKGFFFDPNPKAYNFNAFVAASP